MKLHKPLAKADTIESLARTLRKIIADISAAQEATRGMGLSGSRGFASHAWQELEAGKGWIEGALETLQEDWAGWREL